MSGIAVFHVAAAGILAPQFLLCVGGHLRADAHDGRPAATGEAQDVVALELHAPRGVTGIVRGVHEPEVQLLQEALVALLLARRDGAGTTTVALHVVVARQLGIAGFHADAHGRHGVGIQRCTVEGGQLRRRDLQPLTRTDAYVRVVAPGHEPLDVVEFLHPRLRTAAMGRRLGQVIERGASGHDHGTLDDGDGAAGQFRPLQAAVGNVDVGDAFHLRQLHAHVEGYLAEA